VSLRRAAQERGRAQRCGSCGIVQVEERLRPLSPFYRWRGACTLMFPGRVSEPPFWLWAEVAVGNHFPRWWLDVATAVHFYEAVLATLAIFV
jgi:hypothetical protein